jgi:hypothetical protein
VPLDVATDRGGVDEDSSANTNPNQFACVEFAQHGSSTNAAEESLRFVDRRKGLEGR